MTAASDGEVNRPPASVQKGRLAGLLPLLMAGLLGAAMTTQSVLPFVSVAVQHEMGLSQTDIYLVINSFTIAQAAVIAGASHLTAVYGSRRILLVGLVTATVGYLAAALSWNSEILIGGLVLAGFGVGTALPASLASVASSSEAGGGPAKVGRPIGVYFAAAGVMSIVAPIVGAGLIESVGWQFVFIAEISLLVPAMIGTLGAIAKVPVNRAVPRALRACTLAGVAFTGLILGCQLAGEFGWGGREVLFPLILGAAALIALGADQLRSSAPLFNRTVLSNALVIRDSGATFLVAGAVGLTVVFTTLFVSQSIGLSPLETSMFVVFLLLPQTVMSVLTGRLYDSFGFRSVASIGALLLLVGTVGLAIAVTLKSEPLVAAALALTGLGLGAVQTLTSADAQQAVDQSMRAEAAGVVSTSRNLGSAWLVAFGATFAATIGETAPFWLAVAVALVLLRIVRSGASRGSTSTD